MAKSLPLTYEWQFPLAATNLRVHRKRLRAGELSLCEGVDGRYYGGLRHHAGFNRLSFTESSCPTDITYQRFPFLDTGDAVIGCWYVDLRKGTTSNWINGFLVHWHDTSGSEYILTHYAYDEATGYWNDTTILNDSSPLISSNLSATSTIDCVATGKFVYIAVEGETPVVMYYDTGLSVITAEAMGPGVNFDTPGDDGLQAPVDGGEDVGGYLKADAVYAYAYRFYNSSRGIYSAISSRREDTIGAVDSRKVTLTNPDADPDRAYDQGYDKLHIYRTLSAEVAGTSYVAGLLFKESEYDLDAGADCWPATVEVGTTRDEELMLGTAFDPVRDVSGSPPTGGVIESFEGVTFIGDPSEPQLHWSQLHQNNPEVFPVTGHTYQWPAEDGLVQRMVRGGDNLYVFTENAVFRIAKAGSQLAVGRMHSGRTLTSRNAVSELGRDVLAVSPLGVSIYDGSTGKLATIGGLDRLIIEDWVDNLSYLYVVSDGPTGTSYVLNPTLEKTAILWHVTGALSLLADTRFVAATEGPHPEDGGKKRAFFVTTEGAVLYPDADRSGTFTTMGLSATVTSNGTVAAGDAGTSTTLTSASGTFDDTCTGAYLYWVTGTNKGSSSLIASVSGGTITMLDSFTMTAGDAFCVSPVPFRVRVWPVPRMGNPYQDFGRRVIQSIGIQAAGISGGTSNDTYWTVGACRNFETTPSITVEIDMDTNPADSHARLNVDGIDLEPWVQAIVSGGDWELLSVTINGTINVSRNVSD